MKPLTPNKAPPQSPRCKDLRWNTTTEPLSTISREVASLTPFLKLSHQDPMTVSDCRSLDGCLSQVALEDNQVVVLRIGIERLHFFNLVREPLQEGRHELTVLLGYLRLISNTNSPSSHDDAHADGAIAKALTDVRRMVLEGVKSFAHITYLGIWLVRPLLYIALEIEVACAHK